MWPWRLTLAGMTVLPFRSIAVAPATTGASARRPAQVNCVQSTKNAESSMTLPSPVMRRAFRKIVWPEACEASSRQATPTKITPDERSMRRSYRVIVIGALTRNIALIALAVGATAMAQTRTLDIYVIDVEGGNATLFVSPSHESLLIDTGNAGAAAARDAGRIMEAA